MSWNYRVMRNRIRATAKDEWYTIHEVYYNDKGEVDGWTEDAIAPGSETVEGLLEQLTLMLSCLDKECWKMCNLG